MTPRGKLAGVPASVRHLWSLLFRSVRRQAVAVDELRDRVERLYGFATEVVAANRRAQDDLARRASALEADVDELVRRVAYLETGNLP